MLGFAHRGNASWSRSDRRLRDGAAASLSAAGLPVVVVNPAQVRAFANAWGKRAKTDPIDAAVIAHFIEATKPKPRPLPDEATRQLSDLVGRRSQIIAMIVAERQRKKHHPNKPMLASIGRLLAALQRELSDLDGQIREAIQASPVWREKDELPESAPGVGPAISGGLMAGLPELGSLDRRQIAALGGRGGRASPADGRAKASSAADAPRCAALSLWGPWRRSSTIARSRPSTSA